MTSVRPSQITNKKLDDYIDKILPDKEMRLIAQLIKKDKKIKKEHSDRLKSRNLLENYFSTEHEKISEIAEKHIDEIFNSNDKKGTVIPFQKKIEKSTSKGLIQYINVSVDKLIPMAAAAFIGFFSFPYLMDPLDSFRTDTGNSPPLMRSIVEKNNFEKIVDDFIQLKETNDINDPSYISLVPEGKPFYVQTQSPINGDIAIYINVLSKDGAQATEKGKVFFQQKKVMAGETLIFPENKKKGILLEEEEGIRIDLEITSKSKKMAFTRYFQR